MSKLQMALAAWALLATLLLVWGILGNAPWENSQRDLLCEDALVKRRALPAYPDLDLVQAELSREVYYREAIGRAEAEVDRWCK
jgi:hypothetical protein